MKPTENIPIEILPPAQVIERFFRDYPAEKAQSLLWCWFELGLSSKVGKLHPKELQQFTDFFERLGLVVLSLSLLKQQEHFKASGIPAGLNSENVIEQLSSL